MSIIRVLDKVLDGWNATAIGIVQPSVELGFVVLSQQALKADGQMTDRGEARHFLLQHREHPTWRSVSSRRGFMQIAPATTGEIREPDAGSSGNEL
jgi:hypothetical protein